MVAELIANVRVPEVESLTRTRLYVTVPWIRTCIVYTDWSLSVIQLYKL